MHNTQFPYFVNKKQTNLNQQNFTRTNNGWIVQGNTQAPEETQILSLSITNKYKIPLNNINKQPSNVYYKAIPQQQPYSSTSQVRPISLTPPTPNVYYNTIPKPQSYPLYQAPPILTPPTPNVYYNFIPQSQHYPPVQKAYYNNTIQPQYSSRHQALSPTESQTPQTEVPTPNINPENVLQNKQLNSNIPFNNIHQYNCSPTTEELLPLIHEVMDIARTQKALLNNIINIYTKHEEE
ncbi:MAG: hypothetical protein ACRDBR_03220 [Metamycoplasmataceae bacterium]